MLTLLGVVVIAVALLVSIMLHEFGHFLTARRFGMKAPQFFVGFGPRVFSWKRGETEYGLRAIPAGGFCKIVGMTPEEELADEDKPRAFYRKPGWQRAIVLAAGSFTHFVIAFIVLLIMAGILGLPQANTSLTVAQVSDCVSQTAQSDCDAQHPPSPAKQAGLQKGDRFVAFEGEKLRGWDEFSTAVAQHGSGKATMTVVRDGERRTVQVDLASLDGSGFLGISPVSNIATNRLGPIDSMVYAGETFGTTVVRTGELIASIPASIPGLFTEEREAGESVGSVVAAGQISGFFFSSFETWYLRAIMMLSLVVSLNISVGIINLLPLFPLDGSHLAVLAYERARAGIARLRGKRDPGPVDVQKLAPVAAVAFVFVVGFGLLLIAADILNPMTFS